MADHFQTHNFATATAATLKRSRGGGGQWGGARGGVHEQQASLETTKLLTNFFERQLRDDWRPLGSYNTRDRNELEESV
jgi:hypothetical protein